MLQPIDISKGAFTAVEGTELPQGGYATELRNLLINKAGSNVDRPALSAFASCGGYPVMGLFYFRPANVVVAVTNEGASRKVWSITEAGVTTDITGTALTGSSRPVFASDGTYLAIAGGGAPIQWSGSGTTAALAGSPEDTTHIAYLDGYWILPLLSDQELRWAGPTAVSRSTWNSANFFQAEGLPDNISAITVLLRELYCFGPESTEIFQNFGDTSTPFRRTFFLERGIIAPYSLTEADNTLWWLDNKRDFVRMEGRTPVIKSEPIASVIKGFTTVSDCFASRIEIGGFHLIVWTFPTEERSFCYDYQNDSWAEWDGFVDGATARLPINAHVYVPEWNRHLVGGISAGQIYTLSFSNKADGSNVLRRKRVIAYDWGTSRRKRSEYYLFHVRKDVATASTTAPVFQVRVNDDKKGWSEPQLIALGTLGSNQTPIRVRAGGIYRRRELEITMTDPVAFSITRLEEETTPMES